MNYYEHRLEIAVHELDIMFTNALYAYNGEGLQGFPIDVVSPTAQDSVDRKGTTKEGVGVKRVGGGMGGSSGFNLVDSCISIYQRSQRKTQASNPLMRCWLKVARDVGSTDQDPKPPQI